MKKLILFSIAIVVLLLTTTQSHAVIHLRENGVGTLVFNSLGQTEGIVSVGLGEAGGFELLLCATRSDGSNSFLDATPGWTTLDNGSCGGSRGCILGIFTRTDDSPASSQNNCRWVDSTNMGGLGTFRYGGVDPSNFTINIDCNTGSGGIATAPSILTGSNTAVVRVFTSGGPINPNIV